MRKKSDRPETRVKNVEPEYSDSNWVIWAAWADRISFEEIRERTGLSESDVIRAMRNTLKPSSFRLWRKRVANQSLKHRKKFQVARQELKTWRAADVDHSGEEAATNGDPLI